MHPGDLAGGFSDLEMTWLLYCADAATAYAQICALLPPSVCGLALAAFTAWRVDISHTGGCHRRKY